MRYFDVCTLIRSLDATLPEGSILPVVDMDWHTGEASVYEDIDDANNGIVAAQAKFRFWCSPRSSTEYANEISDLLRRGHSLSQHCCGCFHGLDVDRCQELGIAYERTGRCEMKCDADQDIIWSCESISSELAVENICNLSCSDGVLLLDFLKNNSEKLNIRIHFTVGNGHTEKILFLSGRSTLFIKGPDELVAIANKAWPLPVSLPDPRDSYNGIERDALLLQAQGRIRILPGSRNGSMSVFGEPFYQYALKLDNDVRALWRLPQATSKK